MERLIQIIGIIALVVVLIFGVCDLTARVRIGGEMRPLWPTLERE